MSIEEIWRETAAILDTEPLQGGCAPSVAALPGLPATGLELEDGELDGNLSVSIQLQPCFVSTHELFVFGLVGWLLG